MLSTFFSRDNSRYSSLSFRKKRKDKKKISTEEHLTAVFEGLPDDRDGKKEEEEKKEVEEEVKREEIEETYTLGDLPHTPLSGTKSPSLCENVESLSSSFFLTKMGIE